MRYSVVAAGLGSAIQGDWLSGRAPRSHRGGHWFDPSIAHQVRGYVDLYKDHQGSHSCSQAVSEPVSEPVLSPPWRAGGGRAKTASTSTTPGNAATLRPIGIARAVGGALSASSPAPTVTDGARRFLARTRQKFGPSSPSCTMSSTTE